jgi:hypothetical protein
MVYVLGNPLHDIARPYLRLIIDMLSWYVVHLSLSVVCQEELIIQYKDVLILIFSYHNLLLATNVTFLINPGSINDLFSLQIKYK